MERVLRLNFLLGLSHPLVPLESLEGGSSIGAGVKSAMHSRGRRAEKGTGGVEDPTPNLM